MCKSDSVVLLFPNFLACFVGVFTFRYHGADLIQYFPSVIHVSNQMARAAKIFEVPVVVTEQYPKAMGKTVAEVDLSGLTFPPVEKMLFRFDFVA
jgi:hypothetical protein